MKRALQVAVTALLVWGAYSLVNEIRDRTSRNNQQTIAGIEHAQADLAELLESALEERIALMDENNDLRDSLAIAYVRHRQTTDSLHAVSRAHLSTPPVTPRDSAADRLIGALDAALQDCQAMTVGYQRLDATSMQLVIQTDVIRTFEHRQDSLRVERAEAGKPGWLKRTWEKIDAPVAFVGGVLLTAIALGGQ